MTFFQISENGFTSRFSAITTPSLVESKHLPGPFPKKVQKIGSRRKDTFGTLFWDVWIFELTVMRESLNCASVRANPHPITLHYLRKCLFLATHFAVLLRDMRYETSHSQPFTLGGDMGGGRELVKTWDQNRTCLIIAILSQSE